MRFSMLTTGAAALLAVGASAAQAQTTLTIVTVHDSDLIRMQGRTPEFDKAQP